MAPEPAATSTVAAAMVTASPTRTPTQRPRGVPLYRVLCRIGAPLRRWVRLDVRGLEVVPPDCGVLLVSNHDSLLDPLAVGEVLMRIERPVRFLAKNSLWKFRITKAILDGIGQIPIRRGTGDVGALDAAVAGLEGGEVICIFPEGTLSRGKRLRARSGVGRLALAAPDARIVLAAVTEGTVFWAFPRRPRMRVEFFLPEQGQAQAGEDPAELAGRLMDEIRERIPPVALGEHPQAPSLSSRGRTRPRGPAGPVG